MAKLQITVSGSFEKDVLKKAAEMVKQGKTEDNLGIENLGPLKIYIDTAPKKTLHIFEGTEEFGLKDKKIYVGTDA
jgi:hypothetical protein